MLGSYVLPDSFVGYVFPILSYWAQTMKYGLMFNTMKFALGQIFGVGLGSSCQNCCIRHSATQSTI